MGSAARRLACAAIAFILVALCHSGHAQARPERFDLAIPRSSLVEALSQFSRQTGLQVGTQLDVSDSTTDEVGPFVGRATADETLRQLLKGSDLWFTWQNENTIRIFRIPAQPNRWSTVTSTAKEASDSIRELSGAYYETGSCGDYIVGPFESEEPISAETYWIKLIEPHCPVIYKRSTDIEPGSIDRLTAAGESRHDFAIDAMPRFAAIRRISEQAGGLLIGYLSKDEQEEQTLVGPIRGLMSVNEALSLVMRGSELRTRWVENDIASVEPAYKITAYADMSKCRCSFGLPELWPLRSEHVTVVGTRLPTLVEQVQAPVFVGDQRWIASTGATTIPELFRYIPQFAFHRSSGYRLSGAQYFEGGRGLGAEYTLVLIDGRRAFASAADPMVAAFDLNSVPLPAVERIEISFDQASPALGTDAIGGTVNIILKKSVDGVTADALLGAPEGGGAERRGTLRGGYDWGRVRTGAVVDYFDTEQLLGADRSRWRNQDFTRFDATDQRSRYGAPPNIRAITGNLPGLNDSAAAVIPDESGTRLDAATSNLTSLRSFQSVVPASERTSLYGFMYADIGSKTTLRAETLLGRRRIEYQLMPTVIPGFVWGASHPENPVKQDVLIETALTGFPIQTYDTESDLARGVAEITSSFGDWNFNAFGLTQRDESEIRLENAMNMVAIMEALKAPDDRLKVASARPGEGSDPHRFMAPTRVSRYMTEAEQFGTSLSGPLASLATGDVTTEFGLQRRSESARFDPQAGTVTRDVDSAFAQVRLPLFIKQVELSVGARHDSYSDVGDVTRPTYGLTWHPLPELSIAGSVSTLYRPPTLYELHRPRIATPTQIFDPARNELAPVTMIFGSNPDLKSTDGNAISLSIKWHDAAWRASAQLWQLELQDRLSAPSAPLLLITDGQLAHDRVTRAPQTPQELASGQPGRLQSIDVTYANFGEAITRGLDISVERRFDTRIGSIGARLDITHFFAFEYSELPVENAPLHDKVGRASLEGTIPRDRAVLGLSYSRGAWRGELFARFNSSVADYIVAVDTPTGRNISEQTLVDVNVSRRFAETHDVTLGIENLFDDKPPFAKGFGDNGYDLSQGDLIGRVAYLKWSTSF